VAVSESAGAGGEEAAKHRMSKKRNGHKLLGDTKMKKLSIVLIVLAMVSVANANLTLTVNRLDTSKIIIAGGDDIVIGVAGQTDVQEQNYSVTCEMGGKLEPLPEPKIKQLFFCKFYFALKQNHRSPRPYSNTFYPFPILHSAPSEPH
jgi:hypothetical protein